jgi:hypothetical protein
MFKNPLTPLLRRADELKAEQDLTLAPSEELEAEQSDSPADVPAPLDELKLQLATVETELESGKWAAFQAKQAEADRLRAELDAAEKEMAAHKSGRYQQRTTVGPGVAWPLEACITRSRTGSDLECLAQRASNGDFGTLEE